MTPSRTRGLFLRLATIRSFFRLLGRSKRWWLAPLMAILLILGLTLVGLQAVEYAAPFIYAVF
jgi:hypothetical protein